MYKIIINFFLKDIEVVLSTVLPNKMNNPSTMTKKIMNKVGFKLPVTLGVSSYDSNNQRFQVRRSSTNSRRISVLEFTRNYDLLKESIKKNDSNNVKNNIRQKTKNFIDSTSFKDDKSKFLEHSNLEMNKETKDKKEKTPTEKKMLSSSSIEIQKLSPFSSYMEQLLDSEVASKSGCLKTFNDRMTLLPMSPSSPNNSLHLSTPSPLQLSSELNSNEKVKISTSLKLNELESNPVYSPNNNSFKKIDGAVVRNPSKLCISSPICISTETNKISDFNGNLTFFDVNNEKNIRKKNTFKKNTTPRKSNNNIIKEDIFEEGMK